MERKEKRPGLGRTDKVHTPNRPTRNPMTSVNGIRILKQSGTSRNPDVTVGAGHYVPSPLVIAPKEYSLQSIFQRPTFVHGMGSRVH